jgi:hypothetical protein
MIEMLRALVWLSAYGVTALSLAVGVFQLVRGRLPAGSFASRASLRCLFAVGLLPLVDIGQWLSAPLQETGRLLAQALTLGGGLLLGRRICLAMECPATTSRNLRLRVSAGLLAAALPTMLWCSHRLHEAPGQDAEQLPEFDLPLPTAENLAEVAEVDFRTDRGARIPVYRFADGHGVPEEQLVARLQARAPAFTQSAIQQAPAELRANCHGWVFAGGEFIVRGAAVDQILQDNGYRAVSEPQPGDVIVYRDIDNHVLHTGVVKATGNDGFLLIESKWGLHGRFLHEPQHQSYSSDFAYYRSPRRGHRLDRSRSAEPRELRPPQRGNEGGRLRSRVALRSGGGVRRG